MKANESFNMSVAEGTEPININSTCFYPFDIDSIKAGNDPEHAHEQAYSRESGNQKSLKEIITRQIE